MSDNMEDVAGLMALWGPCPQCGQARLVENRDGMGVMTCPAGHLDSAPAPDIEWAPDHRSLVTTHRIRQADGSPPVQTRELPWPLWPFELVSRLEARVRYLLYERDRRRAGW